MAVIRNLVVKISADISSLSKGLQNAQKSLQKVSQSFTKIGGTLTATITGPLVALGTSIVKTSAQFEQSMANAASVAGATGEELQRMTDIAREMGRGDESRDHPGNRGTVPFCLLQKSHRYFGYSRS